MSDNAILKKLETIEKNQKKSSNQAGIAFGISIAVVGWNFLTSAVVSQKVNLILASTILVVLGIGIMVSSIWRLKSKSKEQKKELQIG